MKVKFRFLCQLLIVFIISGLTLLIYTGCGSDDDDFYADADDGHSTLSLQG